jgi:hypothetical protein
MREVAVELCKGVELGAIEFARVVDGLRYSRAKTQYFILTDAAKNHMISFNR